MAGPEGRAALEVLLASGALVLPSPAASVQKPLRLWAGNFLAALWAVKVGQVVGQVVLEVA
jgi:CBS-domain-containing membrane protein